jgi:hypothetical protein
MSYFSSPATDSPVQWRKRVQRVQRVYTGTHQPLTPPACRATTQHASNGWCTHTKQGSAEPLSLYRAATRRDLLCLDVHYCFVQRAWWRRWLVVKLGSVRRGRASMRRAFRAAAGGGIAWLCCAAMAQSGVVHTMNYLGADRMLERSEASLRCV